MIKSLSNMLRQDRERMVIPKSVQQAIPIRRIWQDGIFQVGNKFSKCIRFSDINYAIASKVDKQEMFLDYSELLNSLDVGATTKITISNRQLNKRQFEESILLPKKSDGLDHFREEYNQMLMGKVTSSSNSILQERYVTISVHKKDIDEARTYFARVVSDVSTHLAHMGSHAEELDATERLRIFHDFLRPGSETAFRFDIKETARKGHDFKDYICPDSLEFKKDHFVMGGKYGRVLFFREYASYIRDSMISELTEMGKTLMLSIDVIPVNLDEAVREMQSKLLGVETNAANWQRKQNTNNNYSAVLPYDIEQQRKETREMLDDLTSRDQRLLFAVLTLVHVADSLEELDADTETLQSAARKHLCQLGTLNWQQADGLNTVLPYGLRKIDTLRTLTTEALSVLMPFKAQEIMDTGGVYYGVNAISKNLIVANRKELLNANGFILGVSGSGKSFAAKREILSLALSTDHDILIIDPESEFPPLVSALGGEVVKISATSHNHINALDMEAGYGDGGNPVVLKSEFILSLCEQLMGAGKLGAKEKSVIDRCAVNAYRPYMKKGYKGDPPTLKEFHTELLKQPEPEARDVALAIELFTNGSLNTFAQQTNVDTNSRIISYDIRDLGRQLLPVGMLVVLDSIFNRVIRNRERGRATWIFIDEIYLLFSQEYSTNFLFTLWKRVRKYNAACTGITQNIEDLLQSHTARTMLSNSEFTLLLNQSANDRLEIAKLLGISENQLSYVTNAESGSGLLKCAGAIVAVQDRYPHNATYRLMTTKPSEMEVWQA
ncbi:VirB4-like conjugal transfer ATPase, CD1110 family [Christensenella minuta]|uniref:VirB4-like conjugal transfer ATPase, CD1110 family n=1 Tax=Christensenella minuta TaxID=626937 RepID=UPI002156FE31|nr:ATP-binding protein [Christensenella minuta]